MRKFPALLAAIVLCVLLACPSIHAATMSESAVNDAMAQGDAADKSGDYAGAETIYNSVVANAPNSPKAPEAMAHVGALQYKTNRRAESMNTYKALVQRYPDTSEAATVWYRMGAAYMRDKSFQDSQDAFRASAENKSVSVLDRGRALLQVSFVDMMRYFGSEFWGTAVDGSPILIRPDLTGGRELYLDSARKQFEATRDLFAKSQNPEIAAVADAAIGETYLLSGQPAQAEEAYRNVSSKYGPIPGKLVNLAQCGLCEALYGQGKLESALVQFDQALRGFSPGGEYGFGIAPVEAKADLHAWKVLSLYGLKRFDEALVAAREGKTEMSNDSALASQAPTMELWEGLILCQMDRISEGLPILRSIITDHPGTSYAAHASVVISQFEEANN